MKKYVNLEYYAAGETLMHVMGLDLKRIVGREENFGKARLNCLSKF